MALTAGYRRPRVSTIDHQELRFVPPFAHRLRGDASAWAKAAPLLTTKFHCSMPFRERHLRLGLRAGGPRSSIVARIVERWGIGCLNIGGGIQIACVSRARPSLGTLVETSARCLAWIFLARARSWRTARWIRNIGFTARRKEYRRPKKHECGEQDRYDSFGIASHSLRLPSSPGR